MTERLPEIPPVPFVRPAFKEVGPDVDYAQMSISPEQAEAFRRTLLEGAKINELHIGETSSLIWTSSYATGILSNWAGDHSVDESAYFAKSVASSDPNFWRSVIYFARYNEQQADTKIYNIYEIISHEGEVMSAVRKVRTIRNLTQVAIDKSGEPYNQTVSRQRREVKYALQPSDIDEVAERVRRVIGRQAATDPR